LSEEQQKRYYQLWEYSAFHGEALIRSPKDQSYDYNVDIFFFAVRYMSLPRHIEGLIIETPCNEDVLKIEKALGKHIDSSEIHVLNSSGNKHYIVASQVKVRKSKWNFKEGLEKAHREGFVPS